MNENKNITIDDLQNVYVPYQEYLDIIKDEYHLGRNIKGFKSEELPNSVLFYDEDHKYIDDERFEVENIIPKYVLLPRFLFLENIDIFEHFVTVDNSGNKKYISDYLAIEKKLINEESEQINFELIQKEMEKLHKGEENA